MRSLHNSGRRTIKLLAGLSLAEFLQHRGALNKALHERIRKQVVPEELQDVHGALFLGCLLAESSLLKAIDTLQIYGEQASVASMHFVGTVPQDQRIPSAGPTP